MKPPKKAKRSGAPAKGYKWKYLTDGRIPNPEIVPVAKKPAKLKSMRTVSGGVNSAGKAFMKVNNRIKRKY